MALLCRQFNSRPLLLSHRLCACVCQFIETCAIQRGNLAVWNQRSRRELPAHYWRVFTRRAISACIWMVALVYAWWLMFSDLPSPNDRSRRSSGVDLIHALSIALPLVLLLIFAIVFMLIMSAMRSFYMDPKLYLEGATKKASGLQTIIGVVCLISAIATLSQPPPPPTHTAGA